MTEAQWLSGTHPFTMLEHLVQIGRGSERKLRLYAAACCRANWSALDDVSREAAELGERFSDGDVSAETLREAYRNVLGALADCDEESMSETAYGVIGIAYLEPHTPYSFLRVSRVLRIYSDYGPLGDIFGNPFRPTPNRDTLPSTVVTLAEAAYEEKTPNGRLMVGRLAVVADALEEAGFHDALVLAHLRDWPVHYRGCWVIDWILGRT